MSPWLSVVGIGEDGLAGLSPAARTIVDNAEILIGGERHLAMVPPRNGHAGACERLAWPNPLTDLVERIPAMRGRRVCVLATGDPMQFGIGATLSRQVPPEEMAILPGISAFTLAAARLAWPLDRATLLTLHGRPVDLLARHVAPGAPLIILSHDAGTASAVRDFLVAHGFGDSRMVVLAHMGGPQESRVEALARDFDAQVPDFHTLGVECIAGPDAVWHPRSGLLDEAFQHDGKLTKREFRVVALAKLMPHAGASLIDVGAGCGSVSIEWLRAEPHTSAIALEPRADRRALAAQNAAALGVPHLDIRDGTAPAALADISDADAIFIGGGISEATIAASLDKLKPGGRCVAHAVTLASEAVLLAADASHGCDRTRISIARADKLGDHTAWRPALPIT